MADIVSVSRTELANRRRRLRQQRRWRALQGIWRLSMVVGMAGGAVWLLRHPAWVIASPQQVEVEGNRLLSDDTVKSMLEIDYPKALWQLSSEAIARQLESQGIIAQASVTRHLFPPSLTLAVQERDPVAIAILAPPIAGNETAIPHDSTANAPSPSPTTGLLDATGFLVPMDEYTALEAGLTLPTLRVIGFRAEQQLEWASFYRDLSQHQQQTPGSIAIQEINWSNPSNLILTTELGSVHLGGYSSRFPAQLRALDQLRQLPTKLDLSQVVYIDLQNPDNPLIQTRDMRLPSPSSSNPDDEAGWDQETGAGSNAETGSLTDPTSPDAISDPAIAPPAAW
ncbi:FtsQ-type POTRA domain-containing protein [Thermoleptolyngbya sichuanensis A183]|uniref:FtsQ-type POTRA domain-containing protein n=1 Tax=Thermoleptolyngbya sichuanensis A183 TaxID=2737172 RepID=A0A6M8BJ55_9CYAN|nr:FtsQ-type POTRA domain-containing protein [Thermoleptolyngbya sichuanensis]MDG2616424.1 FtsQ-type POTRA domain-containing protein [Thermoleptolyngbya sichuanensis XZ-Cy5]QKD84526.1 FtsQ-type POTRA domain-containing protein [Thermoleptolyngbya sichuanensis A183]